jgi:hypothetical protein
MRNIRFSEFGFEVKGVRFPREGNGSSVNDNDSHKITNKQEFYRINIKFYLSTIIERLKSIEILYCQGK